MATLQNSINANATTPLLPIQGGTGVSSPTAHGIMVAEGASAVNPIVLTNGQLLIGSTGNDPVGATITAGTGISITNAAGAITINNTEVSAGAWSSVTTSTAMVAGNNYFAASASVLTFTLPATAAVGDTFQVAASAIASTTGKFVIAQNAGQQVQLGNLATTSGATGTLTANFGAGDWIKIVCSIANTNFVATSVEGAFNVA